MMGALAFIFFPLKVVADICRSQTLDENSNEKHVVTTKLPRLWTMYPALLLSPIYKSTPGAFSRSGETLPDLSITLEDFIPSENQLSDYRSVCDDSLGYEVPLHHIQAVTGSAALWIVSHPNFPFPLLGAVHTQNQTIIIRPLKKDEKLTIQFTLDGLSPHRRGSEVKITATVTSNGTMAMKITLTLLVFHKQMLSEDHILPPNSVNVKEMETTENEIFRESLVCPSNIGRIFARICADYNPIHLFPFTAKLFGLKTTIAHGMWVVGNLVKHLNKTKHSPSPPFEMNVSFKRPVFLPCELSLQGCLSQIEEQAKEQSSHQSSSSTSVSALILLRAFQGDATNIACSIIKRDLSSQ